MSKKKGAEKKKESTKKNWKDNFFGQLFHYEGDVDKNRFWVVLIAGNRGEGFGFDSVDLFSTLLGQKLVRWVEMGVATLWIAVVGDEGERGQSQVLDGSI